MHICYVHHWCYGVNLFQFIKDKMHWDILFDLIFNFTVEVWVKFSINGLVGTPERY